jgi:hypothetical protein
VKPMEEEIRAFSSSNKWPCYVLTDATVYLKDGKRPANPLLPNQPWVVRGRLEVDPKEQRDMRTVVPRRPRCVMTLGANGRNSARSQRHVWIY